jgi:hypothetical protein
MGVPEFIDSPFCDAGDDDESDDDPDDDMDNRIDFEDPYPSKLDLQALRPLQSTEAGAAPESATPGKDPVVELPPHSSSETISSALKRTSDVLEVAGLPPKACHCTCTFGRDGGSCLNQFLETEKEEIR